MCRRDTCRTNNFLFIRKLKDSGSYPASPCNVQFVLGETSKTVRVAVLDDSHDEGEEGLSLTISNASPSRVQIARATATGRIVNSDMMPRAWNARFGRGVAEDIMRAVRSRVDTAPGTQLLIGGRDVTPQGAASMATATRREGPGHGAFLEGDLESALLTSAFRVSTAQRGASGQERSLNAWGRAMRATFDGLTDEGDLDGEITSAVAGLDVQWDHQAMAGVIVAHGSGEGDYDAQGTGSGMGGHVRSTLTGVYPYASVALGERLTAWVVAGHGAGSLKLTPQGSETLSTDLSMWMAGAGTSTMVLEHGAGAAFDLDARLDALWSRTSNDAVAGLDATHASTTRVRSTLEASRTYENANGLRFTPTASLGLRHDSGDAEKGFGLEMGTGARLHAGALTLEGAFHILLTHADDDYEQWGASAALSVDPGTKGRGLALALRPRWGMHRETLWEANDLARNAHQERSGTHHGLGMEASYGVALRHGAGRLTPYASLDIDASGVHSARGGARWALRHDASMALEVRRAGDEGEVRAELSLRF